MTGAGAESRLMGPAMTETKKGLSAEEGGCNLHGGFLFRDNPIFEVGTFGSQVVIVVVDELG